jgi:hypothetical protein
VTPINLLHYPFGPPDGIGDGAHRSGHACSAVVLRQLPCGKNSGCDQQNALSALVHGRSITYSLFVRHYGKSLRFRHAEQVTQRASADEDVPAAVVQKAVLGFENLFEG